MPSNPNDLPYGVTKYDFVFRLFRSESRHKLTTCGSEPNILGSRSGPFITYSRSFVPPVRDEESETQRKAHAKRVRETRRSTQGVTLEDLKSAEQIVKKKQQQENQQRTSELQHLAGVAASTTVPSSSVGSTATGTTSNLGTSGNSTAVKKDDELAKPQERRPSWRLKVDATDKNRVRQLKFNTRQTPGITRKTNSQIRYITAHVG